jgi:hypothetical protein
MPLEDQQLIANCHVVGDRPNQLIFKLVETFFSNNPTKYQRLGLYFSALSMFHIICLVLASSPGGDTVTATVAVPATVTVTVTVTLTVTVTVTVTVYGHGHGHG